MTQSLKFPHVFAMFPGQGSQKLGMGRELYEANAEARSMFEEASTAINLPLYEICLNGPIERLTLTEIAQPAILTVSSICYRLMSGALGTVAAAGHSLGEYSALVAAGALDFGDAVKLVHKRGKYMQEAVPVGSGKMVAILGKEVSQIEEFLSQVTDGVAEIANINAPGQVVVSGDVAGVSHFMRIAEGSKLIELNVSAPFHSSLMKPAEDRLRGDLLKLQINRPRFPVYANFNAQPLTEPEEIREALALQVCGRVRWVECVENALKDTPPKSMFEFGEGNTLTGLLKRIDASHKGINITSYQKIQELLEV